jgi:putative ABC transport system permease protein
MPQLLTDIRFGVRMLFKYPTLSLVALLTLGVGIGLSTTVFCIVNGAMFKGLPFPAADRVVALVGTNTAQKQPRRPIAVQDLAVFQERQTSFESLGAYGFAPVNLSTEDGRPERFRGGLLTVAAFNALGVPPVLGRGFRTGDDLSGADPVMLLSYSLWHDRYASSSSLSVCSWASRSRCWHPVRFSRSCTT